MKRVTLWGLLCIAGCSGRLIQERALPLGADRADLDWTTKAPDGEGSLWLRYEVHADTRRAGAGEGSEPVYDITGSLTVKAGAVVMYQGPLALAEHKPPTTAIEHRTALGSHSFCGLDGCTVGGRVEMLSLEGIAAGTPLQIQVALPTWGGDFALQSASVQIRAK